MFDVQRLQTMTATLIYSNTHKHVMNAAVPTFCFSFQCLFINYICRFLHKRALLIDGNTNNMYLLGKLYILVICSNICGTKKIQYIFPTKISICKY